MGFSGQEALPDFAPEASRISTTAAQVSGQEISPFGGTTLPAEQEAEGVGGRRSGAALHYFPLRLQMAASFPTFRSVS